MRRIELREREECLIPRNSLSELEAKLIWEKYRNKIKIEGPSFKNNNHWQITRKLLLACSLFLKNWCLKSHQKYKWLI
jgi:hypothetical protein